MGKEENKFSIHILRFEDQGKTLIWKYSFPKWNMKRLLWPIFCCGSTGLWHYSSEGRFSAAPGEHLKTISPFPLWEILIYFLLGEIQVWGILFLQQFLTFFLVRDNNFGWVLCNDLKMIWSWFLFLLHSSRGCRKGYTFQIQNFYFFKIITVIWMIGYLYEMYLTWLTTSKIFLEK